ncbi:hypothetical protein MLD38_040330 [Melastoma candidum]|uniref:Uncharacterized protein n=1 Tax=Melastoma candidum TaxID=119954 RepID=A0ACB9L5P6_9MYRT|nr:hypothetical protein MLD38_040330 [Melastoma candidum]
MSGRDLGGLRLASTYYNSRYNNDAASDADSVSTDPTAFSGPMLASVGKRSSKKSARFNVPRVRSSSSSGRWPGDKDCDDDGDDDENPYVEITLDIRDDSVAVHSVQPTAGGHEDPELALLAKQTLEKRSSALYRNVSLRQVSQELRKGLASFSRRSSGGGAAGRFDRTKSAVGHALRGLKFITAKAGRSGASGWPTVEKKFDQLTASSGGLLHFTLFGECIGMNKESKEFAGELFRALAQRRNIFGDSINKDQLKEFWDEICDESFDSRLNTFFAMVDKDADGRITEEEVREIISLSASANKLSSIQKQAQEYAALIMEELDPDNLGFIMLENLEMLLLQAPDQSVRLGDSRLMSQILSQKLKPTVEMNPVLRRYNRAKYFLMDNWKRVWFMALWIAAMAGLFTYKFIEYSTSEDYKPAYRVMGSCLCVAKGGAEILKLNMALILLPVCRNTITWLRNKTRLGAIIPFDDNLNFHKVIATGIMVGVGLHAGSHLTCDFPRVLHATTEESAAMEEYFHVKRIPSYWWFVRGIEGVTGIIMVILMAVAFTLATPWFRRNKVNVPKPLRKLTGFNAFWYSHHLFVFVYALLVVHGVKLYLTREWYKKTTWMYLAVPVTLYACERLIRLFRSSIKPVKILKVAVYPGNVLALHMSKPHGFKYRSGQYMFVNCSAVSPFEWHPFSITSAPGDDYLSVHIRTLGDWTRQLKVVFSKACQPPPAGKSGLLRADCGKEGKNNPGFPRILIDGPYGAPAQDYKKYDVVLLVGLGIGATPMVSIVKDIINNIKRQGVAPAVEPSSSSDDHRVRKSPPSSSRGFRTRKAYFYWVTREQGSFDWFKGIMNEVAEMDEGRVIELHNYCTSVYEEGDARSALIAMLQSLHHAKSGVDVVSGMRVKSHFAKPDWRQVYKNVALHHQGTTVGVFYCGAPALTKELRQLASFFSHKTSTKFDFHKENF